MSMMDCGENEVVVEKAFFCNKLEDLLSYL